MAFVKEVYFQKNEWGEEGATSKMGVFFLEAFQIEVGLYCDVPGVSWKTYGCLATKSTWFKNWWELCKYLWVKVLFHGDYHVKPLRIHDCSIMSKFNRIVFVRSSQESLGTVRKYFNIIHLSNLVCCDRNTINQGIFSGERGMLELHVFPAEQPIRADFKLWEDAITNITLGEERLSTVLRVYLQRPHLPMDWTMDWEDTTFYQYQV